MRSIFIFLMLFSLAYGYEGKVIAVTDGDTIKVLDSDNVVHKVRLYGIDAPEKKQAYGTQSKKYLSELIFGKIVVVEQVDIDRYKREIGKVYLGQLYVNADLVSNGWAWHYVQYAKKDKLLAEGEKQARDNRIGLWSLDIPVAPWDFRKKK